MTFSANAKGELSRLPLSGECCELAELSAIIHTAGTISISGGAFSLRIDTENASVARRIFLLVKSLYGTHINTQMHTNQLKHNHIYSLYIDKSIARMVAQDTRLIGIDGIHFDADSSFLSKRCCIYRYATLVAKRSHRYQQPHLVTAAEKLFHHVAELL